MGRSRRQRESRTPTGGVLIWKPSGPTSRRALEEAERTLGYGSLGHTGTLDPLAEGLLLLLGGEARKFQALLTDHHKSYRAEVTFGVVSDSEDREGPLWCPVPRPTPPDRDSLEAALGRFRGGYDQIPPGHSAVRVDGQRAWRRVRRGEIVELDPRPVVIERLEVIEFHSPRVVLEIDCGPGTYIRSLARDLGEALGCGAHLSALARTRIGSLPEAEGTPLAELSAESWWPLETILAPFPRVEVDPARSTRLSQGQRVPLEGPPDRRPDPGVCIIWCEGRVVGLGEIRGGIIQPRRWLSQT